MSSSTETPSPECVGGPLARNAVMLAQYCARYYEGVREAALSRSPMRVKNGLVAIECRLINLHIWERAFAPLLECVCSTAQSVHASAKTMIGRTNTSEDDGVKAIHQRTVTKVTQDAAAKSEAALNGPTTFSYRCSSFAIEYWNDEACRVRADPKAAFEKIRWLTVQHLDDMFHQSSSPCTETLLDLLIRLLYGWSSAPPKQILVKPLLGPIRVLRVGRTHTVADLKQALWDSDGIPIEAQRLVYRARELDQDHISLIEAKVEDEAMLYLGLRHALQGGVQVRVQADAMHPYTMELSPWETVAGVVRRIQHDGNLPRGASIEFLDFKEIDGPQAIPQQPSPGVVVQHGQAGTMGPARSAPASNAFDSSPAELLQLICQCINDGRSQALSARATDILDRDCIVIDPNFGKYCGIEQCMKYYSTVGQALGNVKLTLAHIEPITRGNFRVCFTLCAMHQAELFGIKARGRDIEVQGIAFHSFSPNRKIKLSEYNWNAIGVMKQLMGVSQGAGPSVHATLPLWQGPPSSLSDSAPEESDSDVNFSEGASPEDDPREGEGASPETGTPQHLSELRAPQRNQPLQPPLPPKLPQSPQQHLVAQSPQLLVQAALPHNAHSQAPMKNPSLLSSELPLEQGKSLADTRGSGIPIAEAAMEDPNDLLQLVSDDFNVSAFNIIAEETKKMPQKTVKQEFPNHLGQLHLAVQEQKQPNNSAKQIDDYAAEYALAKEEYLAVPRRGFYGQEGPVHGTKLCLRFLEYQCGYCGDRKISTSAGGDGRVRIRCECGGKHADATPRMHAKWKLCTDTPLANDILESDQVPTAPTGGRPFSVPNRPALAAAAPY